MEEILKILPLLSEVSPGVLDKLLEHDKWKTRAQLDHEYRIEELKFQGVKSEPALATPVTVDLPAPVDDDFNLLSSFGACEPAQGNSISRTRVAQGAKAKVLSIFPAWAEEFTRSPEYKRLKGKDNKQKTFKDILILLLWTSGCLVRANRWPTCRDMSKLDGIKTEALAQAKSYDPLAFESTLQFTVRTWDKYIYPDSVSRVSVDVSLFQSMVKSLTVNETSYVDCPVIKAFATEFPHLLPEELKKLADAYEENPEDLQSLAIKFLFNSFENNPPPGVVVEPDRPWNIFWRETFMIDYKDEWENKVKDIENTTKTEQKQWQKELTS